MTIKELKSLLSKSKAYVDLYQKVKDKPYFSEEALISEEAEHLKESYSYIFSKTGIKDYSSYIYFIQKCILPHYQSFNEVVEILRSIQESTGLSIDELTSYAVEHKQLTYAKYSTVIDALNFLKLS